MPQAIVQPVIRGVGYFLAHTPGLVRYGSKPAREIAKEPGLMATISAHLRPYEAAAAYPPNQAFLGSIFPDDLRDYGQPWFKVTEGRAAGGHMARSCQRRNFMGS